MTPETVFNGLVEISHFYFCLLVAVRLKRKQGGVFSNRQKNAFIMKWLKKASFSPCARSEILWLRGEILRHPPDRDKEPILMLIYKTASAMAERDL